MSSKAPQPPSFSVEELAAATAAIVAAAAAVVGPALLLEDYQAATAAALTAAAKVRRGHKITEWPAPTTYGAEHQAPAALFDGVRVVFREREDGGLSISSPDLPGLILSGADAAAVASSIPAAIKALRDRAGLVPPEEC